MSEHTDQVHDPQQSHRTTTASGDPLTYDEVSVTTTAGYRPMVAIIAVVVVSGVALVGGPLLLGTNTEGISPLVYTALGWGVIIVAAAIGHEYAVTRNEDRGEIGDSQ